MSERRTKLNGARTALLAGAAMVALAVACDTPVPTEVRRAFEEAEIEARDSQDEELESRADRLGLVRLYGADIAPVIYIDGIRIVSAEEGEQQPSLLGTLNPDNIDRIEVIKGGAAKERLRRRSRGRGDPDLHKDCRHRKARPGKSEALIRREHRESPPTLTPTASPSNRRGTRPGSPPPSPRIARTLPRRP